MNKKELLERASRVSASHKLKDGMLNVIITGAKGDFTMWDHREKHTIPINVAKKEMHSSLTNGYIIDSGMKDKTTAYKLTQKSQKIIKEILPQ